MFICYYFSFALNWNLWQIILPFEALQFTPRLKDVLSRVLPILGNVRDAHRPIFANGMLNCLLLSLLMICGSEIGVNWNKQVVIPFTICSKHWLGVCNISYVLPWLTCICQRLNLMLSSLGYGCQVPSQPIWTSNRFLNDWRRFMKFVMILSPVLSWDKLRLINW